VSDEERPQEVLRIDLNGATFYAVAGNERAQALADARAEAVRAERAAAQGLVEALRTVVKCYDERNEAFGFTEHKDVPNEFNAAREALDAYEREVRK
jgi:hypothetical protein